MDEEIFTLETAKSACLKLYEPRKKSKRSAIKKRELLAAETAKEIRDALISSVRFLLINNEKTAIRLGEKIRRDLSISKEELTFKKKTFELPTMNKR